MYSPFMDAAPTSSLAGLTPASGQPALPAALSVVPLAEPVAPVQSLSDSRWFINRELSWLADVLPNLERAGFRLLGTQQLSPAGDAFVDDYFWREVFPVLTPIALDPGHPFPHLRNKTLNLAVRFRPASPGARLRYGVVPVPSVLPRLVEIPNHGRCFVLLEDVISRHAAQLFPGMPIDGCWAF